MTGLVIFVVGHAHFVIVAAVIIATAQLRNGTTRTEATISLVLFTVNQKRE